MHLNGLNNICWNGVSYTVDVSLISAYIDPFPFENIAVEISIFNAPVCIFLFSP